jgi:hypothetical protein
MEWHRCRSIYKALMSNGIPSELLIEIEPIYDDIVKHCAAPAMFSHLKPHPGVGSEPISAKFSRKRLWRNVAYWRYDWLEAKRNPRVTLSAWSMTPLAKAIRWTKERKVIRWFRQHALARVPEDMRFCTYFLHYQPEYTVEGVGYPFADQVAVIRAIAQSLPVGVWLLVKEQPFMLGLRSQRFYEELLSMPNVRLASEAVNSRELILRSQIVFTISGTAALEAMFYGVPAVVFSHVFHSEFEGITPVYDLYTLSEVVRTLLTKGLTDNRKSALAALAAMYAASYPGELMSLTVSESGVLNEENISQLGNALIQELRWRKLL